MTGLAKFKKQLTSSKYMSPRSSRNKDLEATLIKQSETLHAWKTGRMLNQSQVLKPKLFMRKAQMFFQMRAAGRLNLSRKFDRSATEEERVTLPAP